MRNRVRELRAHVAWSQAELAELLGVSRQTVNSVETGKYTPSLELAFAISHLFGVPLEALFFPDDE